MGLSREELAEIVAASPVAIHSTDRDGAVTSWNAAAERLYGWTAAEVIGAPLPLIALAERDGFDAVRKRVLEGDPPRPFVTSLVHKNGGRVWVTIAVARLDDGVVSFTSDMETLQHNLRVILDAIPAPIFFKDAAGVYRGCNKAFEAYLGKRRDEIVGKDVYGLSPKELADVYKKADDELLAARGVQIYEAAVRYADGTLRDVMFHKATFDDSRGRLAGLVGTILDITTRKQAEAAQRTMHERLALADRMSSVGTLAGGVAHEINNPLSYVIGNLTLLDEALRAAGNGELGQLATEALDGLDRIRRIVRDLKTFSRADDDVRGPLRVPRVIDLAVAVASNEIRHRARLVRELDDVPPVIGNEARLGQVLVNLLMNAAQAIPEGDADHHEIKIVCRASGDRVVIEVHDTGSGIDDSIRARIFEPFFTTKPVGTGTGLGLAASHGIVTAMGGEISALPGAGRGSIFRVSLPAAPAARAPETIPPQVAPASGVVRRGKILIADDEPIVTRTLARFLSREHDVAIAKNGREALDAVTRSSFDVILCDLMMPEMTGMDVHAALVERDPSLAERMIFMTGGAFTARARDFLDRVPNPRLEKPFTMPTLEALIREKLR
ncbi:MAG TPA: PAS domain S-box protein [Kofleriaceae bacterium]|nr:PAS domain S-box protein [Kofleriaceae bacterium]